MGGARRPPPPPPPPPPRPGPPPPAEGHPEDAAEWGPAPFAVLPRDQLLTQPGAVLAFDGRAPDPADTVVIAWTPRECVRQAVGSLRRRAAFRTVVHLEDDEGGAGELLLFVVLTEGADPGTVIGQLRQELRSRLSPRHLPDGVHVVPAIPKTLSGKKLEVPVKRILQGTPASVAAAAASLQDPTSLEVFVAMYRDRAIRQAGSGGSA